MYDLLKIKWAEHTNHYAADAALAAKFLGELERKYAVAGRHYHTLQHIHDMLQLSHQYGEHLRDPAVVDFAIFYHDVIYNVWRRDNEERSAALATTRLAALGMPDEKVQLVKLMIEASHTHQLPPGADTDPDAQFFLDFDLSILGAEWATYFIYSSQVRKEYQIYPDMLYKAGRRKFLQNFLEAPAIFHSPVFREHFEPRARQNMEKELQFLAS